MKRELIFLESFFDGFGPIGLFTRLQRPGAPVEVFAPEEMSDVPIETSKKEQRQLSNTFSNQPAAARHVEKTVLIVTAMEGAENLARALSREAHVIVEIARSRRAALARLRRDPVTALLMDTSLPDAETTTSEMVWQNAAGVIPLEISMSTLGPSGVIRLLRNVLHGREQAETLGRKEAATAVAQELQATITSLLLQSDMLLRDEAVGPVVADRVRHVRDLSSTLHVNFDLLNSLISHANTGKQ